MNDKTVEQEQDFEVVDLLSGDSPEPTDQPTSKYEQYAARIAEQEAAEGDTVEPSDNEPQATDTDEVTDPSPEIPSKFSGKSKEDIIESYLQLESEFGKRGNDLGELRKLTDQLLELNKPKTEPKEEKPQVDVDTLLENPEEAIRRVIQEDETLKELKDKALQREIAASKKDFEDAHPDYQELMNDPSFTEWVMKNPLRQRDLVHADQNYDFGVAKAVFDDYKETHGKKVKEATTTRNESAREAAKAAATESGGNVEQTAKRKKFKRSELIQLKIQNPSKYEAMREQIMAAYANGDVI